jgi:hypothetical protein
VACEVVDIDYQFREWQAIRARALANRFEQAVETAPVGHAGQAVAVGHVAQLPIGQLDPAWTYSIPSRSPAFNSCGLPSKPSIRVDLAQARSSLGE